MYPSEQITERWFYDQVQDAYDEETRNSVWDLEDEDEDEDEELPLVDIFAGEDEWDEE